MPSNEKRLRAIAPGLHAALAKETRLRAGGQRRSAGQAETFTRFVGWLSQDDLPAQLRACDVLMMPTIAQEALGRTAVEAMAAGRQVIASRQGELPFTVADGATGFLCEPGDVEDLARKIER